MWMGFYFIHTWMNGLCMESFKLKYMIWSMVFLFIRKMNPAEGKLWHRGSASLQKESNNSHAFKCWGYEMDFSALFSKSRGQGLPLPWVTSEKHLPSSNKCELYWVSTFVCHSVKVKVILGIRKWWSSGTTHWLKHQFHYKCKLLSGWSLNSLERAVLVLMAGDWIILWAGLQPFLLFSVVSPHRKTFLFPAEWVVRALDGSQWAQSSPSSL